MSADPGARLEKTAVNYRPAHKERRCGTCVSFRPERMACDLVAGEIHPAMVCDRWVSLKRSHSVKA